MTIIKRSTLSNTNTTEKLCDFDCNAIEALSETNLEWVKLHTIEVKLGCEKEDILDWLRKQSSNKINSVGEKRLGGYTVVKSWMFDPASSSLFIAFSPYLFDGNVQSYID